MALSRRSAWGDERSRLCRACDEARAHGRRLHDLTVTNPTAVGLLHPPQVYDAIAGVDFAQYQPHALGLPAARQAIADYYAARDRSCDPASVWLAAGTSELYFQLLTVLCDPGQAVAVPQPGYPLLDIVGDLAGVRRVPYAITYDGRWHLDLASLRAAAARPDVTVVTVIAPGNPTGHYLEAATLAEVQAIAAEHEVAVIVDEVFADFPIRESTERVVHPMAGWTTPAFVVSGLSKVAALPQVKLSWGVAVGPDPAAILSRVEQIADAFLSCATPIQRAAGLAIAAADAIQPRIVARLRQNVALIDRAVAGTPLEMLAVEGGWTALLRLPQIDDDEGWAVDLVGAGVIVDPGYLFDLSGPPKVAVSLLTPPPQMQAGIGCLVNRVRARVG